MNISRTSETMLKYQKAKAKLIEYGVEKADYPAFPLDSNELSYSTVYIISRYAESIIEDDSVSRNDFFNHLKFASQYFDAAVSADDRNTHDLDFLLSGAAAYFLSNDFGSAKVLCSKIDTNLDRKSPQGLLLSLFRSFLLNKVFLAPIKIQTTIDSFIRDIKRFFDKGQLDKSFYSKALEIREMVYDQDNPLDVYYVDILLAVLFESINHSSWVLLPRYTSLNNNEWITYLSSKKAIKILWPSQQLICEKGILKGANAIVQLPTGVGKTKSIELVIRSAFYTERANNAIIIAPLRSLCNEITYDLTQSFEEGIAINQFSDVLQDDYTFSFTNDENKNNVMVCTPEKLSYIMHHQPDCISEFDLFIFDEAHMFDDGYRGVTYEFLVSEIKNKVGVSKQIILLSAVLSNANEINNWLFDGQGVLASDEQIKPTPKSIGFVSTTRDMYYFTSKSAEFDFYIPRSIDIKALQKKARDKNEQYFPQLNEPKDIAIYYGNKLCKNGGVAIYVDRTASVKTIIDRMLWLIDRGYNLDNTKNSCDKDESSSISKLIADYYGESHSFTKGAKAGVFPHYADLPNGIKIAVEYAIRNNKLNFIVCTTTLAQGVNIPIRYLFMTSIMTSRNKMQIRNFQNLIGRTARSGMYTEGSIIITNTKLYDERNKYKGGGKYRWDECIDMFNPTNNEPCGSSILALTKGIVADYETSASGMKIAQYIIEHFFQEHCFENLTEELTNWYEQRHPDRKSDSIFIEIKFREKITEAIENHLCYIFANNLSDDYYVQANAACKQTLAYALANDEEKELLINIFKVITDKIISIATKEQIANYSRTVIGIDLSQKISEWLTEKEICMIFYSETQLLDMILDFFYSTHDGFKKISKDQFKEICSYWIDGFMYCDIVRKLGIKNIKDVEYLCGKKISFELSFFIGNIIDMFVSSDDDVNPYFMLTSLQKKVKYGVNSNTAISICEAIFNDRRISNLIADYLNNTDIKPDEIIEVVKNSRVKIENLIDLYPSFYKERIALL